MSYKRIETIASDSCYAACDLYEIVKDKYGFSLLSPEGREYTARAGQRRIVGGPYATTDEARDQAPRCEMCDKWN